jgi:hypothetical protein
VKLGHTLQQASNEFMMLNTGKLMDVTCSEQIASGKIFPAAKISGGKRVSLSNNQDAG